MSCWTYIHATIEVNFGNQSKMNIMDFFADCKDERYSLCFDNMESKGRRGCEITGSELNAVIVAEPLRDHVLTPRDRYWHENTWSISIHGSLRDRVISETVAEWNRFMWKLAWFVRKNCAKLDRLENYDMSVPWSKINYYMVDIHNYYERYTRSSIDRELRKAKEAEERMKAKEGK